MQLRKFLSRKFVSGGFLLLILFLIFAVTLPGWTVAIWLPVILFSFLLAMRKEILE